MRAEGWYRDPYQLHEDRWFSDGRPTSLVRDHGTTSRDEPPPSDPSEPLVPVPVDAATGPDDLRRADELTRTDQSFHPADGARAVLDSGEFGVDFG